MELIPDEKYLNGRRAITSSEQLRHICDRGIFHKIFNSSTHWTRVTVIDGAKYEKDVVLRALMFVTYPVIVFPALYQIDGTNSFFLVKYCSNFIQKLAQHDLKISDGKSTLLNMKITTNYLPFSVEPLDVHSRILNVIAKRYDGKSKTLDLSNFSQDERLKDIYFNFNIPQCSMYVIGKITSRTFCNAMDMLFNTLILQHNGIDTLCEIKKVNSAYSFLSLDELDLRNNNLTWEGFEEIKSIGWKLNSIWLNGNPLCINLTESEYIRRVIAIIPSLKKIDGVSVSCNTLGQSAVTNFLFDGSWGSFIDHFLHHYFGLLESPNRHLLLRLYHQNAKFTLCAYHDPKDTSSRSKLSKYLNYSRNIQTLSDVTKAYTTLKTGPKEIMEVLNSLPIIQFDPNTFTVDVPISEKDSLILIDVGGVFKELDSEMFYFHRSFVLTPFKKNEGEWKIETDMLSVSSATPEQVAKSFKRSCIPPSPEMLLKLNPNVKDRDSLIPVFCELTKLKPGEAIQLLEEGSWDLETTLQAFTDQLKANQIPVQSFDV